MRVGMVTREFLGIGQKKSGVADAVSGLSKALIKRGHDVTVFMPIINGNLELSLAVTKGFKAHNIGTVNVPFEEGSVEVEVFKVGLGSSRLPKFIFLNLPIGATVEPLFSQNEAMVEKRLGLFFDRAASELMRKTRLMSKIGGEFDILHSHTGAEFFSYFSREHGMKTPIVYTVHHLERASEISFPEDEFSMLTGNAIVGKGGFIEPYEFALDHADKIVVVSENHADELKLGQTIHKDERFFPAIDRNSHKMIGILNGLDGRFTPHNLFNEGQIPATFDRNHLDGKQKCHEMLQARLGLHPVDSQVPIILWSARLVPSKGVVEFSAITNQIHRLGMQIVIFGSGEKNVEAMFEYKAAKWPTQLKFVGFNQFNSAFEPLFIAGSDVIVLPSLEEPCGLLSFKAMRLGTLPLVNPIGGLGQVVIDNENGFVVPDNVSLDEGLSGKIEEMSETFRTDKKEWRRIQRNAMSKDSTWLRPAEEYTRAYHELVNP